MTTGNERIGAWAALLRTHAVIVPQLERAVQRAGLPLTWYDVLLVLNAAPGRRLTMGELGHRVVVSRERVSRVVGELERDSLVERHPNPDDGRSFFAAITPEGRSRLRAAAPAYLDAVESRVLCHLTNGEVAAVAGALWKVAHAEEARQ